MTTPAASPDDLNAAAPDTEAPATLSTAPPAAHQAVQRDGVRTTIVGNLAADPVVGYTATGNLWVRLNVASHERIRGADGAWTNSEPTYTETVMFGPRAAAAAEMNKGDRVEVAGKPEIETFTRRDGTAGAAMKVIATSVAAAPLPERREAASTQAEPVGAEHVTIHHNADHTIASGVRKEDVAIRDVLKDAGFKWSAARRSWYLPASMPPADRAERVDAANSRLADGYGTRAEVTSAPAPGTPLAEAATAATMTGRAPAYDATPEVNSPSFM